MHLINGRRPRHFKPYLHASPTNQPQLPSNTLHLSILAWVFLSLTEDWSVLPVQPVNSQMELACLQEQQQVPEGWPGGGAGGGAWGAARGHEEPDQHKDHPSHQHSAHVKHVAPSLSGWSL